MSLTYKMTQVARSNILQKMIPEKTILFKF